VVDPERPAGTAARTNVSLEVQEATLRAPSKMLPGRIIAPSHGQISHVAFVGVEPRSRVVFLAVDRRIVIDHLRCRH
jgi:N-methylhydantoinase B/oxoprolinase/acetone carboxylase alpha subunit